MECTVTRNLIRLGKRHPTAVPHGNGQRVFDQFRHFLGHQQVALSGPGSRAIAQRRLPANLVAQWDSPGCCARPGAWLAAHHDAREPLRPGRIGQELGPRQSRYPSPVRGVDDDFGLHCLAPGAVCYHDAGRLSGTVPEHIRCVGVVEERDSRLEQRPVKGVFDLHRRRHGSSLALIEGAGVRNDHDLADQHSLGARTLLEPAPDIAGRGVELGVQREGGLDKGPLAQTCVADNGLSAPCLTVIAHRDGDACDFEPAGALEEHESQAVELPSLVQVEGDCRVGVVLDTVLESVRPLPVSEHGWG